MFGKLFKPRWQHRDAAVRKAAVDTLDPRQQADLLASLAREDASEEVRASATQRLLDLTVLDTLTRDSHSAPVREAASDRMMALLAGAVPDGPDRDTRLHLLRHTGNAKVLYHVAQNGVDGESRQVALSALSDADTLCEIALHGHDEALRLAAAQRLESAEHMKRLTKEGRDKRVVRHAREWLRDRQQAEQDRRKREQDCAAVAEALRQHAQRAADGLYQARLQQLEQRWTELAEHAGEEQTRIATQALEQAHQRLARQAAEAREQQAREAALGERRAALATLRQLLDDVTEDTWDTQLGALRSAVATQERRWQAAAEELPAEEGEYQHFQQLLEQWHNLIALAEQSQSEDRELLETLSQRWPRKIPVPRALQQRPAPAPAPEVTAPSTRAPSAGKAGGSAHQGLVVALRRELQKGNLKHANRLWLKAEAVLEEENDTWLSKQLQRLEERRNELRDWHAFAAQPKKDRLCEQMEALIGGNLDAEEQASAIQALHDEWRELMSSDQDQDQAQWDRFKAASDQAYEPCRAHFRELDEQRADNLRRREQLCRQLADFVAAQDWQRANWQAVWEIRRQAPQEWKSLQPVRFTDARDVQKRFSALLSEIDQQMEGAWREAEQQRQAMIAEAEALLAQEDLDSATREAQQLQKRWRQAGWLPPGRHRPHQKRFRRIMDDLFGARQARLEQRRNELEEKQNEGIAVLEQVAAALKEPLASQDESALRDHAAALDELDEAALGRAGQRQFRRLREQIQERLAALPRWRRWQRAVLGIEASPDGESSEDDQTLTVALEALAGIDSPEHARERRLTWQLEQLPRAMKGANTSPLDEALTLLEARPDGPLDSGLARRLQAALQAMQP
ncbi:DUF349 domain-containing protein [Alloalcanivorax xenomutans]|uniref:DUF349 domain-containing protein n=1 Tax=Alloalcanivorax xenomutans TaxID=1094342 RepID=UPI001F1E5B4F|nr:DUF349 domain-containing protein [Alloalcanivorax xenomutans]MCE7523928.1 DUF349 domain-containing protein [Alloalcanivorax xenomutans]